MADVDAMLDPTPQAGAGSNVLSFEDMRERYHQMTQRVTTLEEAENERMERMRTIAEGAAPLQGVAVDAPYRRRLADDTQVIVDGLIRGDVMSIGVSGCDDARAVSMTFSCIGNERDGQDGRLTGFNLTSQPPAGFEIGTKHSIRVVAVGEGGDEAVILDEEEMTVREFEWGVSVDDLMGHYRIAMSTKSEDEEDGVHS